jgi:hypothetical protein
MIRRATVCFRFGSTFVIEPPGCALAPALPPFIEAVSPGRAIVRLTADGFAPDSFEVLVIRRIHSLTLLPSDTTIAEGDTLHLTATARDSSGSPVDGAWVHFFVDITKFGVVGDTAGHYPPGMRIVAAQRGKYTIKARIFDRLAIADSARLVVVRRRVSP